VVFQLQAFSKASNTGLRSIAKRAYRKKQLVLLWFKPGRAGAIIAAPKELADAISQLRQRSVFAFVDWFYHECSISEYDMHARSLVLQSFPNDVNISSVEKLIPTARIVPNWSILVPQDVIGHVLSRQQLREVLTETNTGTAAETK
jgi:hypothetical protein